MNHRARILAAACFLAATGAYADNPLATITVNALSNRHAIDARVYGLAFASTAQLLELNVPLNRHGGNGTTRYNWQVNASNHAFDWYFQSLDDGSATPAASWDDFVQSSKSGGAQAAITVPMIGWVAKLGANRQRLSSFSIAKYGAQQANDWQWFPDAGNGVRTNGQLITGNDPTDANVLVDSTFQQQGVQHLVTRWGAAASGGVRYYILDNEHSIWQGTHRDVHPAGATMDEIRGKMIDHATKIKAVDPDAIVFGPEEWGWSGYLYSGADQQAGAANGWSNFPDRNAHGGADYLPWLLGQMRANELATGKRLLDVFTVHYYPQGGEYGNDTSQAMQLRRNRSTRSLWDPNYTDETWINDKVRLIPRLKQWAAANYPGTPVGITEWNWGAEGHINGATALADVFGIFGREGLDVGAYWTTPGTGTPAYNAIKMYRNYDGAKSTFGDTSVSASGPNPDNVAVFAAQRSSDRALTVMVINKYLTANTPVRVDLQGFAAGGAARVWQLGAGNTIARLADASVTSARIDVTVPPQSITLLVIPAAAAPITNDFDGSGKADLLFQNTDGRAAIWLMNGVAPTATQEIIGAGTGWSAVQVADFNGDGKADLVWQHTDGRMAIYLMNGTTPTTTTQLLNAGSGWSVTHAADLDGDGKADLVFRNTDGSAAVWLMNGTAMASGAGVMGPGTGWSVTKVADFDGDGKADLLWTHTDGRIAIWLMNGLTVKSTNQILNAGSGWSVAHAIDLNGDGKADLVWQHTDGSVALWLMNGAAMASGSGLLGAGTGWSVQRVADFDGDGKGDLLFGHTDGRAAIYLMNGLTPATTTQILNAGGGWTAKRTLDLNGDGKADIVFQNADGRTAVWLMNGTAMTSSSQLVGTGTGWAVSGTP
ncbi:hypothetical protein BWI17_13030 [Betaproteobacteria bacterium GR16-43]|nr:hypothetical protein BWI17_13030 [Betaproteobacteria bacterium GR16-43]